MRSLALVLACASALGTSGCVVKQGKLRPGLFINPANSRDPDPTRNFAAPPEENPSSAEGGHAPAPSDSRTEAVHTALATIAVIAAGVFPSLVLTGKFDENTWLAPKPAPAPVEQTPAH